MEKKIYFRYANLEDAKFLYNLRNEDSVRAVSFNTDKVSFEDHLTWLDKSIKNPNRVLFVILNPELAPIGQVRFDKTNNFAEISVSLSQQFRGKGFGKLSLVNSCQLFFNNYGIDYMVAKIKKDNISSIAAFEKSGFTMIKELSGFVKLELRRD